MDDPGPTDDCPADAAERTHLLLLDPDGSPTGLLDPDAEARRLACRLVTASEDPQRIDHVIDESTGRLGIDVHCRVAAITLPLLAEMIIGPVCTGLRGLGVDLQASIEAAAHRHHGNDTSATEGNNR